LAGSASVDMDRVLDMGVLTQKIIMDKPEIPLNAQD
jgi:hypothetical protein